MTRKLLLLGMCCCSLLQHSTAQGIAFNPFYVTPTNLNPAFAGMFDGNVRTGVLYRNQWTSTTIPYWTLSASADLPVAVFKDGSYIAAGVQVMKDQAGDGNLINFAAAASASYHRSLRIGNWLQDHPLDVGIGLQVGYDQAIVGTSQIYFNNDRDFFTPVVLGWSQVAMNHVRSAPVSTGISISQSTGKKFNYTIGVAVHNINASADVMDRTNREALGIDRYWSFTAGATWLVLDRLRITPALTYMRHEDFERFIGGSEFGFRTSRKSAPMHMQTSVFVAGWYRTGDMGTAVVGVEHRGVKLGVGYDYFLNTLGSSNGNGGFEVSLKYIAPYRGQKQSKRYVPCSIF